MNRSKTDAEGLNRDEQIKPGRPPRPATEPAGAEGSSNSNETATDPATGAPNTGKTKPD